MCCVLLASLKSSTNQSFLMESKTLSRAYHPSTNVAPGPIQIAAIGSIVANNKDEIPTKPAM